MKNKLTKRQKDICKLFIKCKGVEPKDFAAKELNLSKYTINTHFSDIYTALGVNSYAELMFFLFTEMIKKGVNYEQYL